MTKYAHPGAYVQKNKYASNNLLQDSNKSLIAKKKNFSFFFKTTFSHVGGFSLYSVRAMCC